MRIFRKAAMVERFRRFTLNTGSVQAFLERFEKEALEPRQRILGNFED